MTDYTPEERAQIEAMQRASEQAEHRKRQERYARGDIGAPDILSGDRKYRRMIAAQIRRNKRKAEK